MIDYKVSEDVAQSQLDEMEEEYGPLDPANADVVYDAIRKGLVSFDNSTCEVTYFLQRPLDIDAPAVDATRVTLHEPTAGDMGKIARGIKVVAGKDGSVEVDSSRMIEQAIRLVTVIAKWPLGIAERISRRDLKVVQALSGFFV